MICLFLCLAASQGTIIFDVRVFFIFIYFYFIYLFIDNGAVSEKDLWKDGIHLIESGRVIVANNLINYLNNFLRPMNHPIWGQI